MHTMAVNIPTTPEGWLALIQAILGLAAQVGAIIIQFLDATGTTLFTATYTLPKAA